MNKKIRKEYENYLFRIRFIISYNFFSFSTLIVSEKNIVDFDKPYFDDMDFIFDGFVLMARIRKGSYFERVLTVAKMRGRDHSLDIHPIKIGKGGIKILIEQTPFSLAESDEKSFG